MVEDLEGEVGIVLARDEGGEVVRGEAAGPGVDWGLDCEGGGGEEGGSGGDAVGSDRHREEQRLHGRVEGEEDC